MARAVLPKVGNNATTLQIYGLPPYATRLHDYLRAMTDTELLRDHGLRVTSLRLDMLRILRGSERALTHQELEAKLTVSADRVSIFRSLNAFEEAGLVHRVLDARGTSCFAPCGDSCRHGHHDDAHAHFRCDGCGHVYCLQTVELPKVPLPKGFKFKSGHLELEGTCRSCRA